MYTSTPKQTMGWDEGWPNIGDQHLKIKSKLTTGANRWERDSLYDFVKNNKTTPIQDLSLPLGVGDKYKGDFRHSNSPLAHTVGL